MSDTGWMMVTPPGEGEPHNAGATFDPTNRMKSFQVEDLFQILTE